MKLYSDIPTRRTRQIVADLAMVAWTVVWAGVGRAIHNVIVALAAPGYRLEEAGAGFRTTMTDAGTSVGDLPLVGERVAEPFLTVAGVGGGIEAAGTSLVAAVETTAKWVGILTAATPIILVALLWLALRIRFMRRATAAQRFIDGAPDLDLFALRAMANQPMPRLAAISPDPSGAWRRGDADTITALATLELRSVGLRPPRADVQPAQ